MTKAPSIRGSAQARLVLYRLLSGGISDIEFRFLDSNPASWQELLKALEDEVEVQENEKQILRQSFSHIECSTREGLQRQIKRLIGKNLWLGVFPQGLLETFIDEHVLLIKSLRGEYIHKIAIALSRGIREGRLHKDITKDIRHLTDISKRRAQLIARNGPLQYSGVITKHHQMSAGITSYIWQSSRDERVRDSHRKYDGKIFNWKSSGPHPRSEVNCRCDAVPVFV
ncbi:MAG: minor capsid protein [Myxococcales bacterium]|nr:minor capsid protein [Myxococcales bacterium]